MHNSVFIKAVSLIQAGLSVLRARKCDKSGRKQRGCINKKDPTQHIKRSNNVDLLTVILIYI